MKPITCVFLLLIAVCAITCSKQRGQEISIQRSLENLAKSPLNETKSFVPRIWSDNQRDAFTNTPHVYASVPWSENEKLVMEIPEYVWAEVPGDTNNDSPFYYGRSVDFGPLKGIQTGWRIRFESEETPQWTTSGNILELSNELCGGYRAFFKIVPKDRMFEIHSGIENNSSKRLRDIRFVLCSRLHELSSLHDTWPTCSLLYANGEVISWDAKGQDLSWLKKFQQQNGEFDRSFYFRAYLSENAPDNWDAMPRFDGKKKFYLDDFIDIPAIVKTDSERKKGIVTYSPDGREAFYNVQTPCFHVNTYLDEIAPGESKSTTSYLFFYEGDWSVFFEELAKKHHELAKGSSN